MSSLYFHMIIGSIGLILIVTGLFYHNETETGLLIPLGIIMTVQYIYILETKAGLSNKVIWIQSLSIIGVLSFLLFF